VFERKIKKVIMRWEAISEPEHSVVLQLQKELGVSSTIATLLVQRGMHTFDTAKAFFRPQWQDLHSPFLMRDKKSSLISQIVIPRVMAFLIKGLMLPPKKEST